MNDELEAWLAECFAKGTFATREDAIEFCVGAVRVFCEKTDLNQVTIKAANEKPEMKDGDIAKLQLSFPLKWSEDFERRLRDVGRPGIPPTPAPPPTSNRLMFYRKRCPICGWRRPRSLFIQGTPTCAFCHSRQRMTESATRN